MIWINHNGGVEPVGSVVASNVSIGGYTYTIWEGRMSTWNVVSYVMNTGTTSVSNLDVDLLAADSVSRGYMTDSDYLIDLEAGFEMWQGGAGLATNSYSVNIGGGTTPAARAGPDRSPATRACAWTTAPPAPRALNPVQVYTCNGTGAQQWTVAPGNTLQALGNVPRRRRRRDRRRHHGRPLHLQRHRRAGLGAAVQRRTDLNPQSGKCLDDTDCGGSGTQVQIWDCGDGANQQWSLP